MIHSRFFSSVCVPIVGLLLVAVLFVFVWQILPFGVSESAAVFSCADIPGTNDIRKPNPAFATNVKNLFRADNTTAEKRGKSFSALVKGDQKTLVARKQHLVDLMRNDPDAAAQELSLAIPKNLRTTALETKNCIEQRTAEEGEVRILHADYVDNTTADLYTLENAKGEMLALRLPQKFLDRIHISGEKVSVKGTRLGNDIVPDISHDDSVSVLPGKVSLLDFFKDFVKTAYASIASSMGPQKTLVIMANFKNTTQPTVSQATVDNVVFNQVNDFYLHTSYSKTSIPGTSINWVKLPINATCNFTDVMNSAVAAVDPTVDFRTYQNVMIIAPFSGCDWVGLAYIGKVGLNTADGRVIVGEEWIHSGFVDQRVVGHELGHTLGVHHAGFLNCGTDTVPANISGTGCSLVEYGDIYDVMGTSRGEMNAPHRDYIGWLDPLNVKNVTLSGTYVIEPLETQTLGLKTLRIPRSANGFDDLYVEYRQPLGYDKGLSANIYSGASLHAIGPFKPRLLDATPPGDAKTPALLPGQTFVDPISGTSISVVSANASALTVNIVLGKSDFTQPSITSVTPENNTVVKSMVDITVDATDPSGIGKVEFYQGGTVPFATDTIAPWTALWDSASVPDGTRSLSVRVYDKSGDQFGVVNNVASRFFSLIVYNGTDTTAPAVKIFSPTTGSDVSSPVFATVSADDNVGVIKTELWKDDDTSPITSSDTGHVSISMKMSDGTHSIYAKAFDPAGNMGTSTPVSFFVDTVPPTISFISPLNGSAVPINSTSTITAAASDNRSINQVQFVGTITGTLSSVFLCSDSTPPYSCAWAVPSSVGVSYTIKATAYDKASNIATSTMTITSASNGAPAITTQPASQSVAAGATATFSVVASGDAPLSYQWKKNGIDIVEATASSYTTPATVIGDTGTVYSVIVSNTAGSVTSADAVLTVRGLIGYWKFDETSGLIAADSSGFGHAGTLGNGPIWTVGKVGQALSFDGVNDYVNIPDNAALDLASSYTVSAWVKATALHRNNTSQWDSIVSKGGGGETAANNHNYLLGYNAYRSLGTINRWVFSLENSVGTNCNVVGNAAANLGQWYHIVGVFDDAADTLKIYVDGAEQGSTACTLTPNTNALPVRIGDDQSSQGVPFKGTIDEVRIYNRALTAMDVLLLYGG